MIFIYISRVPLPVFSHFTVMHCQTPLIHIYCTFAKMEKLLPGLAYFSECLVRVREDTKRGFNAYSMRNHEKCTPLKVPKREIFDRSDFPDF